jgi:hypothetical protein
MKRYFSYSKMAAGFALKLFGVVFIVRERKFFFHVWGYKSRKKMGYITVFNYVISNK